MAELEARDLTKLLLIDDLDELQRESARLIHGAGFSGFVYAFVNPGEWHRTGFTAVMNGYPIDWLVDYFSASYTAIDPIPRHCFAGADLHPIVWTPAIYRSAPERAFAEDALGHGVGAGVTFPIRDRNGRWGGFSFSVDVSSRSAQSFVAHELGWARLLAVCVHDAYQRLALPYAAPAELAAWNPAAPAAKPASDGTQPPAAGEQLPAEPLSPRELQCLAWCAAGKSTWEIGRILAISEWTVAFHLKNVRRKFGVSTREQVVARAIASGLIQP